MDMYLIIIEILVVLLVGLMIFMAGLITALKLTRPRE